MTRRLVSAGEVVVDLVLTVPELPRRGADVVALTSDAAAGGAFNVMVAAARQGVDVTYAGLLGSGPMAALAAAGLAREGIAAPLPPRTTDTGFVVTLVEPDGERSFVTTLGAEAELTDGHLARVAVRPDDVVHVSGYGLGYPSNGPCLARWVGSLPPAATLVFDPGPLVADIPGALLAPVLARTDWLSCNETEARALVDDAGPSAMARRLSEMVRAAAVVRIGARGAVVAADQSVVPVPAFLVPAVDLNGAGDAHVGSLIASICLSAKAIDPVAAVVRANAAAACAVTRQGPATAPTTAELEGFLTSSGRRQPLG